MKKRIVVITSDYLYTFVSEAYKEINLDCEVEIVKYDNFKNIFCKEKRYDIMGKR